MTTYTTYEIRSGVFAIEEGTVRMYLIVGSREALLIDTGSGAQPQVICGDWCAV